MRKRNAARLVVLALATTGVLVGTALPASATPTPYSVVYESGQIAVTRFGITTAFNTPGTSVAGCPGSTTITGTVDDATTPTPDNINGVLSISSPFSFTVGTTTTYHILTLTGTATGTNSGNYTGGTTGTFTALQFTGATFNIKTLNPTTCAVGTRVCGSSGSPSTTDGTLNLTATGGVVTGSALPLTTGERIFVNATGSFTNAGCITGSVFGLIIATGATIALRDNPTDCFLYGGTPPNSCNSPGVDPGAIFAQV